MLNGCLCGRENYVFTIIGFCFYYSIYMFFMFVLCKAQWGAPGHEMRYINEAALPCLGVKDAWDGLKANVLLSKIGLYKVFYWDIGRTAPGLR